ncbi:hypothetical protein HLI_04375 [Halobacillus litoralis]|uniref:Uncharacterized protein n=1 Tax=Halobacillus litoralis TaxID=45668 RepID=A0A410M9V6_9BACI|nr:hypothetical protein HLI_04375 [Halobacillus litoralis]
MIACLKIYQNLKEQAELDFNIWPVVTFGLLYPILFGALFALPGLWKRIRQEKAKGFEIGKFLGVGIPSMYVILAPFLYSTQVFSFYLPFTSLLFNQYTGGVMIFSFVFGYLIIDCIRSRDNENIL